MSGVCGRDGPSVGERWGTGAAPRWVRLGLVTSSDPMPSDSTSGVVSGSRRRGRAEAARSASVWVRLSPAEAAVVGDAAARAGLSVGAWVGETAVGRARAQAAGDEPGEAGEVGLSSRRELVAALVALRAEVAAARRAPVADLGPVGPADELLDRQLAHDSLAGADRDGVVVGVLRRIDAVTAALVEAVSPGARRSSGLGWEHPSREHPGRS